MDDGCSDDAENTVNESDNCCYMDAERHFQDHVSRNGALQGKIQSANVWIGKRLRGKEGAGGSRSAR